ncbi:E3 ubiquitin/ISG15 ligase TRIM25-like [Xenopus tropicalis]|uniref:E3 ubiquitin/ISG15 ligase TRIM25-like n=1 Tax=Xenopus tropicalis TaxID=8364 RepID=A0A8J1IZ29_XENTR|nr:E3 ubiquitin/ISG15 ligase TRIM25-like [Xenopus tropicalis]
MAAALRDELSCSICLSIYTDPVSLPCGHNFCRGCIGGVLGAQEGSGAYSCPECRAEYQERPPLPRNRALGNIAERFRPTETEPGETGIFCTYCLLSPVPAAKSCLLCEASLCDTHLRGHCQSAEHVLTEPTASFMGRKCSVHHKVLEYHCCEDSACICVACCLAGEHRGHRVELLSEASEKKKEKLRKVLEKLSPEREETERGAQRLQERRREVAEAAAGETERVTALFRGIREELEALEKRLLSDISRQKEELTLTLTELIQQLEIKKDELSRKIRHIEELCNMADPLTVLQEQWESHGAAFCGAEGADTEGREREGTEGADTEGREREGIKIPAVVELDVGRISETLLTGLAGIVTGVKGRIYGQEATELVLDINTAGNRVSVSGDGKSASYSHTDQRRPQTPERFQVSQALSTRSFPSGRHYWEVKVSESGCWRVGAAYPSIERGVYRSYIGNNNKSWCLYRWNNNYTVRHDRKDTQLPHVPSCRRIRISLDYEAGRLSFYELSEPIRHLHTFTASFTEPLHAAFWVGGGAWVRIIS